MKLSGKVLILVYCSLFLSRVPAHCGEQPGPCAEIISTGVICKQPGKYMGWPSITQTRSGELLVVFSGMREAHVCPFGITQMIRSSDLGQTWSDPETINNTPLDDRDAGILETGQGTLLVNWFTSLAFDREKIYERNPSWRSHAEKLGEETRAHWLGNWTRRSTDGGRSWEEPVKQLVSAPHGPIELSDGRLLYVGTGYVQDRKIIGVEQSLDDGQSWQLISTVPMGSGDDVTFAHEPHVVELSDGKLVAMFRYNPVDHAQSYLRQSESYDGGRSWTTAHPTGIWGYPPHLLELKNGLLLVSYGVRREPYGEKACISRDEGLSWETDKEILIRGALSSDLGYPASIQLEDGSILTVYYQEDKAGEKTCLMSTRWRLREEAFPPLPQAPQKAPSVLTPESVRLKYRNPGLIVDLGVGLWANPIPVDWNRDGDMDLLVSTTDKPSNGLYFFENKGNNLFGPGRRIAEGKKQMTVSWPEGKMVVCTPGKLYEDFRNETFNRPVGIAYKQTFHSGRANQWKYADYNGDGVLDLIIGVSDWRDYGWDDAFNKEGKWTNGPLHGFVYRLINHGSNEKPDYGKASKILADGQPLDVYGKPSPNLVDWDLDGDLDLICGEFLDRISFFENTGSRTEPVYAAGRFLQLNGHTLHLELEMPEVVVFDWDQDHDPDIIVGKEDGRVLLIENRGMDYQGLPLLAEPVYFKQRAAYVKCGALSTPCSFDWDGDGDEDIIAGNTAGFLEFFENLDGGDPPTWAAPVRLKAGGQTFRIMAGADLSIQGPAEAKWGYTVPFVADWNMDGLPDIVLNSIVGKLICLPNIGNRSHPVLGEPKALKVDWQGSPPKPAWNWWDPEPGELVVQWRTRPLVLDLNKDGLNDLVVIDHEGYLSFFQRKMGEEGLVLMPGQRIFYDDQGKLLQLNSKKAGGSGRRKIDLVDWDGDGDLDLLANSKNVELYRNISGQGRFKFQFEGDLSSVLLGGHSTSPTTVDWNKDGIPELLIGAEDGFFYYLPGENP